MAKCSSRTASIPARCQDRCSGIRNMGSPDSTRRPRQPPDSFNRFDQRRCDMPSKLIAWGALAALTIPGMVLAQGAGNYPSRPVTVILPTTPGTAAELETRAWTEKMAENLGQKFVVDPKPGASTY